MHGPDRSTNADCILAWMQSTTPLALLLRLSGDDVTISGRILIEVSPMVRLTLRCATSGVRRIGLGPRLPPVTPNRASRLVG